MKRDALLQYFDRNYISKRDMLPRIPLGVNPDEFWREIQNRRKARSTVLPIHGSKGSPYWYVTTDKMISASEKIVEELMDCDERSQPTPPAIAPLEELFYTSYVEGSPMTMQAAMDFLQRDEEPRDVEEQMILNNRAALGFVMTNLYRRIDESYIKTLAMLLTQNMEGGGQEYRSADWMDIPAMMGETYELTPASGIADRMGELTAFLANHSIHPLIKSAVSHAAILAIRPFPEGNERLARALSTAILIRFGYAFFGDVSLSALIARNGFPYYNAASNILRADNEDDLTYFLEYYMLLLAQAVDERRKHRRKAEEDNINAGAALARTPLALNLSSAVQNGDNADSAIDDAPSSNLSVRKKGRERDPTGRGERSTAGTAQDDDDDEDPVGDHLTAEGYIDMADANAPPGGEAMAGNGNRWSGANKARAMLENIVNSYGVIQSKAAKLLLEYLDIGRYSFKKQEIIDALNLSQKQVCCLLSGLGKKNIIEKTSFERNKTEFIICCGDLTEDDYAPETLRRVNDLAEHSESQIDKRIGSIVRQNLKKGYITADGYEAHGEIGQWYYDMKLAEQMGLVSRVTKDRYAIMRDAQPRLSMLDPVQKMRVRQMYDKFGDETFSLEMVVATLDYSSNKASACLHQFTLLRILDCRKEDQLLYQFIVNPKENPEIFSEAA